MTNINVYKTPRINKLSFRAATFATISGMFIALAACAAPKPTAEPTVTPFGAGPTNTPVLSMGESQATNPPKNTLTGHLYVFYRNDNTIATPAAGQADVGAIEYIDSQDGVVGVSAAGDAIVECANGQIMGLGGTVLKEPSSKPEDVPVVRAGDVCDTFFLTPTPQGTAESPGDQGLRLDQNPFALALSRTPLYANLFQQVQIVI